MKTRLYNLLTFLLLILFLVPARVQGFVVTFDNPLRAQSWEDLIYGIVDFLFIISLPIGALMIMIAAFYFLTSAGDPEKVTRAKKMIIWTIAGIIILFLSKAFVTLLQRMIGVD